MRAGVRALGILLGVLSSLFAKPSSPKLLPLVYLDPPPLNGSLRGASVLPEHLEATFLGKLLSQDSLLGEPLRSRLERTHPSPLPVFFTQGLKPGPQTQAWLQGKDWPEFSILLQGRASARWIRTPTREAILVRLDLFLEERAGGDPLTLPGLIAHELVHAAQASWGGLGLGQGGVDPLQDQLDEAEALWLETRIHQATLRAKRRQGRRLSSRERSMLGIRSGKGALPFFVQVLQTHPRYRQLPRGPLDHPEKYQPSADFFPRLAP